ncbi:MAG: type II CAAX endopeptidase family protein [Holophaga sp.]
MSTLFYGPDGTLRDGWRALAFALGAWVFDGVSGAFRQALALPAALGPCLPAAWFPFLGCLFLTWAFLQLERRPLVSVGLRLGRRWGVEFVLGLLAGAGLMALMALMAYLGGGVQWARDPQAGLGRLTAGGWLYLAVAAREELLFRGYLFQRLERALGARSTLVLTAVLFAGVHWGNPGMAGATRIWASLNIGLAAVLLGLCYLRTRSLALPMGLHLGWNWVQGTLLGFGVSGYPAAGWWIPATDRQVAWLSGGTFGLEASLPCTLVAAAACLLLAWDMGGRKAQVDPLHAGGR